MTFTQRFRRSRCVEMAYPDLGISTWKCQTVLTTLPVNVVNTHYALECDFVGVGIHHAKYFSTCDIFSEKMAPLQFVYASASLRH